MGILGLTHSETGQAIQRLPVAVKVAIGLGPDEKAGRKAPTKLDHFVILRKTIRDKDIVWLTDPELEKLYGESPTEIGIILLDDDPDNVFRTSYAWWTSTECRCRGSLVQISNGLSPKYEMQAIRRTQRAPQGEPWPGTYKYSSGDKKGQAVESCGDGCPDLERGDCKPSGDLYFILDKLPMLGAICRLHTTSYRSVRQIHAGLEQIRTVTGGRLAGIRAMLKVRPDRAAYVDGSGKKHMTTVYVLSLEITAQDMQKLLENMTETAKLFQQTRKLLGGGSRIEVTEDEEEIAPEISAEFHPEVTTIEPAPEESRKITEEQWRVMWDLARTNGWKDEETMGVISSAGFAKSRDITDNKYGEIVEKLKQKKESPKETPRPEVAPSEEAPKAEATKATQEKPKTTMERASALATLLDVPPDTLKAFVAKNAGTKTVKEAAKGTVQAVLTAIEKLEGWIGAKNARMVVLEDKGVHEMALKQWKDLLYAELKSAKK